ncbi:MAG TPA: hypothetical protein VJ869_11505 [Sphaerochaeta sp.]|nr:hypothetical protein [Sphaerochaeta sp.]
MAIHFRTATCTTLLFFLSTLSVFASSSPVRIMIKPASEQVVAIRYQTGTKETETWKDIEPANPILVLEAFDSEQDTLFVQQKETNKDWTRSYKYQYNSQSKSWEVTLPTSVTTLRVMVSPISDKVVAIRYHAGRKEKGTWKDIEPANPILVLEAFDTDQDTLFVQQKETNKDWTRSYKYHYDYRSDSWEVTPPVPRRPLFIDSMDIRRYALFPTSSSSSLYSIVTGAAVKLNLSYDDQDPLYGYMEAGYSRGPSKSDWVDTMQAVNVSCGIGYRMSLGGKFELAPELGYGAIVHILYGDLDQDGTNAYETFIDQQVRLSLNLSIAPTESYELFASPIGVLFFEKARIAIMYGFQAGMRFNF